MKNNDIRITSLNQYNELIYNLYSKAKVSPFYDEDKLFFRGQKNLDYYFLPSIARDPNPEKLILQEHKMVNEFLSLKPAEFKECENSFDILAKMQHHGLPTRLLDITSNPLVALFFACEQTQVNKVKKDGEVFFFKRNENQIIYSSSPKSTILSSYYKSSINNMGFLKDFYIDDDKISSWIDERRKNDPECLFLIDKLSRREFVKLQYHDDRQIRQMSAFIIFPNRIDGDKIEPFIDDAKKDVINEMKFRILIDAKAKPAILKQLSMIGINKSFLFADLDSTAEYIRKMAEQLSPTKDI